MSVSSRFSLSIAALTALISSFLLFTLQLFVGKILLPQIGGTPAVWNTTMVFFQVVMLAGYALTHLLATHGSALIHRTFIFLLGLASLVFFSSLTINLSSNGQGDVWQLSFSILAALSITILLPAAFLCTISTTLQVWLSGGNQSDSRDLMRLYAWSNFGSFLALAAYPTLIESNIALSEQRDLWPMLFGATLILLILVGILSFDSGKSKSNSKIKVSWPPLAVSLSWILISAIPTALFMGATTYITTDIAAFPLLWAIPLGLFLLGATFGFAGLSANKLFWLRRISCLIAIPLLVANALGASHPPDLLMGLHMLFLLLASTVSFGVLYHRRPSAEQLTIFYIMLAVGGCLGGVWSSLLAPFIFSLPIEYPLAMILFCAISVSATPKASWEAALVAAIAAGLPSLISRTGLGFEPSFFYIIPALLTFRIFLQPKQFSFALLALYLFPSLSGVGVGEVLEIRRNFFGVLKVVENQESETVKLYHGTTVHGLQPRSERDACIPRAYYSNRGPLGEFMRSWGRPTKASIAAVGLGTGVVACYARPDEAWSFFEINPDVLNLAQDTRYFTYLSNSAARDIKHIIGDARLTLALAQPGSFDLIILDAFSSDSIPIHLLTKEAFELYQSKLTPEGVIMIHVSNRFLNLRPIIARQAVPLNMIALSRDDTTRVDEKDAALDLPSQWMVLAQHSLLTDTLGGLGWHVEPVEEKVAWSDDFSNILEALL